MYTSAFLLLGTNLGDRVANLAAARAALNKAGTVINTSPIYQTAAWGKTDQPDFLNQAIELQTSLTPQSLLETCLAIEHQLGRQRLEHWGTRTIDIDIILYGSAIIDTPALQLPHPRMAIRRFVLIPLAAIAPNTIHPLSAQTITQLLSACPDTLPVTPYIT